MLLGSILFETSTISAIVNNSNNGGNRTLAEHKNTSNNSEAGNDGNTRQH